MTRPQLVLVVLVLVIAAAHGNSAPAASVDSKLSGPLGVAVDRSGWIYVANSGIPAGAEGVTIYRPNNPFPVSSDSHQPNGIVDRPNGVAAARNGYLYVSADRTMAIYRVSADGNVTAVGEIDNRVQSTEKGSYIGTPDTMLDDPGAVSLDHDDNIFVLNRHDCCPEYININKYAANSLGRVAPLATIRGPKSGLHRTTAITVDSHGNIYAANVSPDTITEYAAGSDGDVAPLVEIAGPQTELHSPSGIAVDSGGKIYVANFASSTITEYVPGSVGNVVPVATIGGPKTGIFTPVGLTMDPGDNLYVANWAAASVAVFARGSHGDAAPVWVIPPPWYAAPDPRTARCPMKGPLTRREASGNIARNGRFRLVRGDMCKPRMGSLAARLPNGQILIAGGNTYSQPWVTNSAEIYDPLTDAFRSTGPMALARRYTSPPITLGNGKVLVIGGTGLNSDAIAELYDPGTGTFARTGRMNVPRDSFAASLLADGRVLVTGGVPTALPALPRIAMSHSTTPIASAELYDPETGTFTAIGNMLSPRARHAAVGMRDGRVLIVGGWSTPLYTTPGNYLSSAELYNPATGAFSATANTHVQRMSPIAVLLNDGRVLVAGRVPVTAAARPAPSLEIYDPSTDSFGSPIALPEEAAAATVLKDGKVLLTGTWSNATAELFDPSTGKLSPTATTLSACPGYPTLLKTGDVLFTGGMDCQPRQIQPSRGQLLQQVGESPLVPFSAELFHEKRP